MLRGQLFLTSHMARSISISQERSLLHAPSTTLLWRGPSNFALRMLSVSSDTQSDELEEDVSTNNQVNTSDPNYNFMEREYLRLSTATAATDATTSNDKTLDHKFEYLQKQGKLYRRRIMSKKVKKQRRKKMHMTPDECDLICAEFQKLVMFGDEQGALVYLRDKLPKRAAAFDMNVRSARYECHQWLFGEQSEAANRWRKNVLPKQRSAILYHCLPFIIPKGSKADEENTGDGKDGHTDSEEEGFEDYNDLDSEDNEEDTDDDGDRNQVAGKFATTDEDRLFGLEMFESMVKHRKANRIHWNIRLGACGTKEEAFDIYLRMQQNHHVVGRKILDVDTFNILMTFADSAQECFDMVNEEMLPHGIHPDESTWEMYVKQLVKEGYYDEAHNAVHMVARDYEIQRSEKMLTWLEVRETTLTKMRGNFLTRMYKANTMDSVTKALLLIENLSINNIMDDLADELLPEFEEQMDVLMKAVTTKAKQKKKPDVFVTATGGLLDEEIYEYTEAEVPLEENSNDSLLTESEDDNDGSGHTDWEIDTIPTTNEEGSDVDSADSVDTADSPHYVDDYGDYDDYDDDDDDDVFREGEIDATVL